PFSDEPIQSIEKRDYATIKYNSTGNQLWVQRYNHNGVGTSGDIANSIVIDGSGNVYVTGYSDGDAISQIDYATVKYSSTGVQQWVQRYNGPGNGWDFGYSICIDNSSNVFVTGYSIGSGTGNDFATIKYNSIGVQQWVRRYNGPENGEDGAIEIQADVMGNVYVAGESSNKFGTIKYNSSGDQLWVKRYESTVNNVWNKAKSICLDNFGNIYVTGSSGITGIENDYATIKYNFDGIEQWVQRYNGPGNGEDVPSSIKVDANGNVYVTGASEGNGTGSDYATIKYSQQLQAPSNLYYDASNNRLIWTLSPSSNVANYLVYKKGSDNIWESVADSGGLVNSNQNYYNIQTSGFNYYRVAAISNSGDTARCDSIYVNRGYVLRRWNAEIIESFKVKKNGFRFGNSESSNGEPILWKSSWYSQFHYFYPPYPISFSLFNSSDYPDWPLFTNVYGRNKCYSYYFRPGNILDSSFLRKSVKKWRDIIYNPVATGWRGACFGMAASSLLAFYKNESFYNQFPILNNVENIYDLSPSSGISKIVNWLHQSQYFGATAGRYSLPVDLAGQTPVIVLNNLESRFSKTTTPGKLNEILAIFSESGGGHAVVPYAIEKVNDSIKYLYIYDNEYPGIDTARFIINTISNSCIHNMNNTPIKRMYLAGSLESFLGEQTFEENIQNSYSNNNTLNDSILFFNSINSSIFYLNQNGDTISGFRITDSSFIGNKNFGFSPMTNGRVNPPVYYKLPYTNYLKVILKDFDPSEQTSFLSFDFDSTTSYKIERTDSVQSNQNDIYLIDNDYFSFVNSNPVQKRINLLTIITENLQSKKEKTFDISKFVTIQNDTVFMKKNNDNLVLKSTGSSKTYTLKLNYIDSSGNKSFYNPSVFLPLNSTHIISPVWDSIKTKPVKIYVDLGNNGTIDDTVFISDTVLTKINNTNNEIPGNYKLYQNYPNPFNPSTMIKYEIKIDGLVTLKVYNILGTEVASLVNEVKQAGRYEAEFNGSNLGSGIYYYRLQAGDFVETKRMVLLK
ncbi:MAG: SBBP repeat-containing protein, partial [Bacteroidetes bacterium]|nr:SBBP repeat-containing protein [Bacteroidota bacterium]